MIIIRHLEDECDYFSFGFNPPIINGEEKTAENIANDLNILKRNILFVCPDKLRCIQTIELIVKFLDPNLQYEIMVDKRVDWVNDGELNINLLKNKADVSKTCLLASKIFIEENINGNIKYQLGSINGFKKYPELENKYITLGGSLFDVLDNLKFISNLLFQEDDKLIVLCCRNMMIRTLLEISSSLKTNNPIDNYLFIIDIYQTVYNQIMQRQGNINTPDFYSQLISCSYEKELSKRLTLINRSF